MWPYVVLLFGTACGSTTEVDRSRLQIIVFRPSDSVGTLHSINATVTGPDGRPVPNVVVRFSVESAVEGDTVALVDLGGIFSPLPVREATTDEEGEAVAVLVYTTTAGDAVLESTVPALGLRDTTHLLVRTGNAVGIDASPEDSVLHVGASYTITAHVVDAYGNAREDPTAFEPRDGPATITPEGVLVATDIGRVTVSVSGGGFSRNLHASVVPPFRLAVFAPAAALGKPNRLITYRSDGADETVVVTEQNVGVIPEFPKGMWPTWSPDGASLAFVNRDTLWITTIGGTPVPLVGGDPTVSSEHGMQFSPDGTEVFFTRQHSSAEETFWRVGIDGMGLEQLSDVAGGAIDAMPTPNPGATRLAYHTDRVTGMPGEFTLSVLTIASGIVDALDIPGSSPRWASTGEIFYLDSGSEVRRMMEDGTGDAAVGSGRTANRGFALSPDGAWYVAVGPSGLELVSIADGVVLPVNLRGPEGQALVQPSWGAIP